MGIMGSREEKRVLGSGPVFILGCAIRVIIVHGKGNARRFIFGSLL